MKQLICVRGSGITSPSFVWPRSSSRDNYLLGFNPTKVRVAGVSAVDIGSSFSAACIYIRQVSNSVLACILDDRFTPLSDAWMPTCATAGAQYYNVEITKLDDTPHTSFTALSIAIWLEFSDEPL